MGDEAAIPRIAAFLGYWINDRQLEQALCAFGSKAEDELIRYLNVKSEDVREAAIEILGKIGGEKSLALIEPLQEDRTVSSEARRAVQQIRRRIE
ncbi:MAG: HEAT repeat domain-containing protein [Planctomycetes bacterium]|nr:HEAT repeat domain-containing protein [Planctomycetota bacterium]